MLLDTNYKSILILSIFILLLKVLNRKDPAVINKTEKSVYIGAKMVWIYLILIKIDCEMY